MRVQIISTNREKSPQTLVPLGACCVASAAESAGHEVHFTDLCFSARPAADTASAVTRVGPDVIGLSIRNLDNSDYLHTRSYLGEMREIADACRANSRARIVIGGSAVGQAPAAIAGYLGDCLAMGGEGERSFPDLLRTVEAGAGYPTTSAGDESSLAPPIADLMSLPDPQPARWLDLRRYAAHDAAMPIQTKRGCAFSCSYCCYPLLEGHAWRLRDPQWVGDQVAATRSSGLRAAEFVDSVFGFPEDHAIACCEAVARVQASSSPVPLTSLELNPLACSVELVSAMNAASFSAVGITAESGSDRMLHSLGKGFTQDDLHRARMNLLNLDAKRMWIFMLGGPGEDEDTVSETARFLESLPHSDLVTVTHGIRILPQTALRDQLVREGFIGPNDDLIEPAFYHSPHVTPQQSSRILAECSFPGSNMITLSDCSHPLAPVLQRIAAAFGMRPPYWRNLPIINQARRVLRV